MTQQGTRRRDGGGTASPFPRALAGMARRMIDRLFGYDPSMTPEEAVRALAEVAAQAGVEVRIERFELALAGKGGLCRIEGRLVVLVDAKLGVLEQAGVIGEALAEVELGDIEVPQAVRAYMRTGHGEVKALVRPRPLVRVK